ncbi:3-phosphoshikimate 1-carboxyvinyltransferase [Fodinibius saliphilus]|uniref:3-phosphoshikimate 1-carboxyvinyltransferase n=1 Tax=Fodinibius saliphilus TaxID=1920650 RepID=UPI001107FCCF|nr:3-phosphoshikimate 1-carboxyvinyltransferase [Fodinibius saliphilus]
MKQDVTPAKVLKGTLNLPADKSISHRSAMFAALYEGISTISNFSTAADPHSTLDCMRKLGVSIREQEDNTIEIKGVGREGLQASAKELDCGNSGTTMRLLSGIIGGSGVSARLIGDESLSARTMKRIIDPLTKMGITIEARDGDYAPLEIHRNGPIKPLHFPLPIASAQLKSCVLLAGLFGDGETEVIETLPSRDHTERLLNLNIEERDENKIIRSSREAVIPEQSYRIPNDFSAAAFWMVAAAIHPDSEINLPKVGLNPSRTGALDILKSMGATVTITNESSEGAEPVGDLSISSSKLEPIHITEEVVPNCIDEIPILAVAMVFADGVSRISGAGELRHKETDRLTAMADVLGKAGADFTEYEDGLQIKGDPDFVPKASLYSSFDDHRIAMSAAVLSMMAEDKSQVLDAGCTAISYPAFWEDLGTLTN